MRRSLAEITVPVRLSVSIGIIYNELITNSAKYAFSDSTSRREIVVTLDQHDDPPEVVLSVGDDGPGFPPEVLDAKQYGFGLTVVESLAAQHEKSLIIENTPGAHVAVTLPVPPEA